MGTYNAVYFDENDLALGIFTSVLNYGTSIVGDLDGDGRITSADATALARYLVGYAVAIDLRAADINGDRHVDIRDLTLLSRWLIGDKSNEIVSVW